MQPSGLILVAVGLFLLAAAGLQWHWFWESRRARFLVSIIGKTAARGFYGVMGGGFVVVGVLITFRII